MKNVLLSMFLAIILLTSFSFRPSSAQTVREAEAFFKDLDDHTLFSHQGRGNALLGQIYGGGGTAYLSGKVWADINPFANAAGEWIKHQIIEANGKTVTQKSKQDLEDALDKLRKDGVLDRLSRLQTSLMKKHFNDGSGGIDHGKLQGAFERFANGELRPNRDMDQMWQWMVWKKFSEACIKFNIDKATWEKVLKSLQKGLEIYRVTHPAPSEPFFGPLRNSDSSDFDGSKALSEEAKKKLREEIDKLSTADVLARQKKLLDDMTVAMAEPFDRNVQFANVSFNRTPDGVDVGVLVMLFDESGKPVIEAPVTLLVTQTAILSHPGGFHLDLVDTRTERPELREGYHFEFQVPLGVDHIALHALDFESLSSSAHVLTLTEVEGKLSVEILSDEGPRGTILSIQGKGATKGSGNDGVSVLFDGQPLAIINTIQDDGEFAFTTPVAPYSVGRHTVTFTDMATGETVAQEIVQPKQDKQIVIKFHVVKDMKPNGEKRKSAAEITDKDLKQAWEEKIDNWIKTCDKIFEKDRITFKKLDIVFDAPPSPGKKDREDTSKGVESGKEKNAYHFSMVESLPDEDANTLGITPPGGKASFMPKNGFTHEKSDLVFCHEMGHGLDLPHNPDLVLVEAKEIQEKAKKNAERVKRFAENAGNEEMAKEAQELIDKADKAIKRTDEQLKLVNEAKKGNIMRAGMDMAGTDLTGLQSDHARAGVLAQKFESTAEDNSFDVPQFYPPEYRRAADFGLAVATITHDFLNVAMFTEPNITLQPNMTYGVAVNTDSDYRTGSFEMFPGSELLVTSSSDKPAHISRWSDDTKTFVPAGDVTSEIVPDVGSTAIAIPIELVGSSEVVGWQTFSMSEDSQILDTVPDYGYKLIDTVVVSMPPAFDLRDDFEGEFIVEVGNTLSFTVQASDFDLNDIVTITPTLLPPNAVFTNLDGNPASGILTWSPDESEVGLHPVIFVAMDDKGKEAVTPIIVELRAVISSEELRYSNFKLVDGDGNPVNNEGFVGNEVKIASVVHNLEETLQSAVYIVQVRDDKGITISHTLKEVRIEPGSALEVDQSWIPDEQGSYSMRVFVVDSLTNPSIVTYAHELPFVTFGGECECEELKVNFSGQPSATSAKRGQTTTLTINIPFTGSIKCEKKPDDKCSGTIELSVKSSDLSAGPIPLSKAIEGTTITCSGPCTGVEKKNQVWTGQLTGEFTGPKGTPPDSKVSGKIEIEWKAYCGSDTPVASGKITLAIDTNKPGGPGGRERGIDTDNSDYDGDGFLNKNKDKPAETDKYPLDPNKH